MKKILLIEDNLNVRETTKEILELADYEVITAENGKQGVESAKSNKIDLIICDIMMPDLDGYGVLSILNRNPETSTIPFIFLTAKTEKSDIRKGMNLGADDYLTKPFEEADLLEAIEIRLAKSENFKNKSTQSLSKLNDFINQARGIDELKNLSKNRRVMIYNHKETIFREDDSANNLYYIIDGKVKCFRSDNYGKEYVHEIYKKGDFLGHLGLIKEYLYGETAITMETTQVAVIPKKDFLDLIYKNRDVAANFIKILSNNVIDREKRLLQLAYAPIRERLADTLLKLIDESSTNEESETKFVVSRSDLANMVGAAKESLIRTLSELKSEGLVETVGQEIHILDKRGLERTAFGFSSN